MRHRDVPHDEEAGHGKPVTAEEITRTEWRILRGDGKMIPTSMSKYDDLEQASYWYRDRLEKGEMGPYQLQRREVTISYTEWEQCDPVEEPVAE